MNTVVGSAFGSTPGRSQRRDARRVGLGLFFGSVCVNAALGIFALVGGAFGETQGKILATSMSVTGALVVGLVCAPAWERRLLGTVPPAAALTSAAGFALVVVSVWSGGDSVTLGKATGTLFVIAGAGALAALLVLATLPPRHAIAFRVALGFESVSAAMVVAGIWLEPEGDGYWRGLGVVLIVLAALAVSIPVLHRMDRAELAAARADARQGALGYCPYCGAEVAAADGEPVTCPRCSRSYTVRSVQEL